MKAIYLTLTALLAVTLTLVGCAAKQHAMNNSSEVPYTVLDSYFVRNDAPHDPPAKITTAEQFEACFGMATVMGSDIVVPDFSKQFVVAVTMPETNLNTTIRPLSLTTKDGKLVFSYSVTQGVPQSYSIRPVMIILIDKSYDFDLKLVRI